MSNKNNILKWRFDVNTFRLLGRELITDRITAVYELVKNCYDANAKKVTVHFNNVGADSEGLAQIIIEDDGHGMSFEDIRDKWMVVGTASKRTNLFSPPPFNRRYVGEKGIGRFAVDKLGGKVRIITKQAGTNERLIVVIDWDEYERLSNQPQLELFTDVPNDYHWEPAPIEEQGTKLEISSIPDNEIWTDLDIRRLERELEKIVSPFFPLKPPFNIWIKSNEYKEFERKHIEPETVKYSSHEFSIGFDQKRNYQETLVFDKEKKEIITKRVPMKSFGPVKLHLYYFNEQAKKKYNAVYKNDDYRVDGVKIYRDGLITTPFAEFEDNVDKKRDILGIDKRRWSGAWDKIGTREIIGILEITNDDNPKIRDATNRQDFVDCREYRELKEFIIDQLNTLGELKKHERDIVKEETDSALVKANMEIKEFESALADIKRENPTLSPALQPLLKQAKQIDRSLKKGIQQQKKERQEHIRKENIYLSLMSLQDYAIHISHAVRTALGKVKRRAEFFKDNFPNPKYQELFSDYAFEIYTEMENLNRIIDFMLSYAGSNIAMEDFNVRNLLLDLFNRSYKPEFEAENINAHVEVKDNFILHANKKFFEDIIENLISNSVKALRNEQNKIIKCTGFIENDHFILYFSDNGEGIVPGNEEKIFEMYHTTTADLGGAGVGLYIVKTRVESLKGDIKVVSSEFAPKGATFKISFPFKKNS
ncbi:sensor histidine kinase [Muricauda sp. 334s03]|uniref:histidine kinase n=1 Tax=Flagellimonas yonaguniensis TaxID=3031325 RepID=A0ABT5Y0H9_9FLAO|nr:sensor histidine kinase [[Muricauda] yonaguniensis]MDF0716944.1 sensor histidine kinase [[Muricauda] yonaguniensis]